MKRLLLVSLLVTASCGTGGSLTFGAAGPWKEGYGAMNRRGIELALQEINARPERAGSPLRIDFQDDEGSGQVASRIAQRFVDQKDIVAVVGHVNSGAMVAAAQVYDGHLAAVATTATSPALTGRFASSRAIRPTATTSRRSPPASDAPAPPFSTKTTPTAADSPMHSDAASPAA